MQIKNIVLSTKEEASYLHIWIGISIYQTQMLHFIFPRKSKYMKCDTFTNGYLLKYWSVGGYGS